MKSSKEKWALVSFGFGKAQKVLFLLDLAQLYRYVRYDVFDMILWGFGFITASLVDFLTGTSGDEREEKPEGNQKLYCLSTVKKFEIEI